MSAPRYQRTVTSEASGGRVQRVAWPHDGACGATIRVENTAGELAVTVTPAGRFYVVVRRDDGTREEFFGSLLEVER